MRRLLSAVLFGTLAWPLDALGADRPIVAVFDMENRGTKLSTEVLSRMSDYLAVELAASGVYETVPRDQIKQRLVAMKKDSFKECYAESCQLELGQELAAQKSLAAQVMKLGSKCMLTATLYDLRKATVERAATTESACNEDGVIAAIRGVVAKLAKLEPGAAYKEPVVERPADKPVERPEPAPIPEAADCDPNDLPRCTALCAQGSWKGCLAAARIYEQGRGVAADVYKAISSHRSGCEKGGAESCLALGDGYRNATGGLPKDESQAALMYQRSCDGNNGKGCFSIGWMYRRGIGVGRDMPRALSLLERSCSMDNLDGCTELAAMAVSGDGMPVNAKRAYELYSRACERNYAAACTGLGWMYKNGHYVKQDFAQAATYFERTCPGNDAQSCAELAWLLQGGKGRQQDSAKAFELYQKSCNLGWGFGCGGLGWMYKYGYGTTRDFAQAAPFLQKGCDGGDYSSCNELAWLYRAGNGVPLNAEHARALFRFACEKGHQLSCPEVSR